MKSTSMSPGYNISFYVFYLFETEFVLVICYFCSNIDYFDGFLLRLFFFPLGSCVFTLQLELVLFLFFFLPDFYFGAVLLGF